MSLNKDLRNRITRKEKKHKTQKIFIIMFKTYYLPKILLNLQGPNS